MHHNTLLLGNKIITDNKTTPTGGSSGEKPGTTSVTPTTPTVTMTVKSNVTPTVTPTVTPGKSKKNEKEQATPEKELYLANAFKKMMGALDYNSKILQQTVDILQSKMASERGQPSFAHIDAEGLPGHIMFKREDKVLVEIKLTFLKINDIDTVNQQFEAEILVRSRWQEPALNGQHHMKFDPTTMWTPDLLVMNLDGEFIINKNVFNIVHNVPGYKHPLVVWLWRFKGFFKENLELQHFPYDVQDLTISLTSERPENEIDLIEDGSSLSSVNTETFMDAQEWGIYEHVETYESKTTLEYASPYTHPIFHAQCRVKRKVGYFMWNIVFIVSLIAVLTFATFSIEPTSADRLAVEITLLLTSVTFKLIVKQSLPTISYLTYLDLYVLAALVFLGLSSSQHAVIKYVSTTVTPADTTRYDFYSLMCLVVIFVSFHLIFGVFVMITAVKRRKSMYDKDKVYKHKKRFLELLADNSKTEEIIHRKMSHLD